MVSAVAIWEATAMTGSLACLKVNIRGTVASTRMSLWPIPAIQSKLRSKIKEGWSIIHTLAEQLHCKRIPSSYLHHDG